MHNTPMQEATCWIVTNGGAGMENQALGLAEALRMNIVVKRIALRMPWKYLPPHFRVGLSHCLSSQGDQLTPPWPQLVIASGRQSILPALYIKQASRGSTAVIYLQNPVISPTHFDLVITPIHDSLSGANVIATQGALHRVTSTRLTEEKLKFPQFAQLPSPRIAVMLGGANRVYRFDSEVTQTIVSQLRTLQKTDKVSLLVSASRRTGEENLRAIQAGLSSLDNSYIWDGQGANPYFAFLAWADAILVTCESVSMISEVCSTNKPVYLIPLPGGNRKFTRFHQHLIESGRIKWFDGTIDLSPATPVNETPLVAQKVRDLLNVGR